MSFMIVVGSLLLCSQTSRSSYLSFYSSLLICVICVENSANAFKTESGPAGEDYYVTDVRKVKEMIFR